MPPKSKSSGAKTPSNNAVSQFDRGPIEIRNQFSTLSPSESISLQLVFFALLEILSLNLTDNDTKKSRLLFQLLFHLLTSSQILPASMSLSAISIGQLDLAQNYVRILRATIQTALNIVQRSSSTTTTTDRPTITSVLEKEYAKVLLSTKPSSNISIDIPQPDIQLKIPLSFAMTGTVATNDFDNIVVFRYVQDFYEIGKLGKGAFGKFVFFYVNKLFIDFRNL
jgi:hypothetical protein